MKNNQEQSLQQVGSSGQKSEIIDNSSLEISKPKYTRVAIIVVVIVAFLIVVIGISYLFVNSQRTKRDSLVQTNVPNPNVQLKQLDRLFVQNAVAVAKGKEIILVDSSKSTSKEIVFTADRCDSIESLKWSPDKSKIAFHIDHYLLKDNKCFSNKTGFEFDFIDLNSKGLTKMHSGQDKVVNGNLRSESLGSYSWKEDSTSLDYSVSNHIWEFNTSNGTKKSIREIDIYKDNFFSPYYVVGEEFYGKGATYIGKFNVANPAKVITLIEENLSKNEFDPGWGETISNFAISPDGEKIIYELNVPEGHSIVLRNVKSNFKKTVISYCKEPVQNNFPYGIGEFSPDSTMFTVYDNCSKDYNLLLLSANGDLLKRFAHKDTKKLVPETSTSGYSEYSYGTKSSSFSNDSKKIFLLNEKEEGDGNKIRPNVLLAYYAFIVDLATNNVNKINFTGTDSPVEFSKPFLENNNEISHIKWSN